MKALTLKSDPPAITSPDLLYPLIKKKITDFYKEHFMVCSLNTRNNLIAVDVVSIGTLTASLVHPREAFGQAIKRHAAHIILAHNHPSGETEPSEDDLKITRRLVDAGKIMGIEVLDHLIITKTQYLSFKEKYLI
ncbi:MAG: DNA repair protein RadC [Bacteroidetes bacterium]|nr:DNA repair protein RadC [Bacteroidota bacterium]